MGVETKAGNVEYSEAFKWEVIEAFHARLTEIEDEHREMTAWEAECLFDAAMAIVVGSWELARHSVKASRKAGKEPLKHRNASLAGLREAIRQFLSTWPDCRGSA